MNEQNKQLSGLSKRSLKLQAVYDTLESSAAPLNLRDVEIFLVRVFRAFPNGKHSRIPCKGFANVQLCIMSMQVNNSEADELLYAGFNQDYGEHDSPHFTHSPASNRLLCLWNHSRLSYLQLRSLQGDFSKRYEPGLKYVFEC